MEALCGRASGACLCQPLLAFLRSVHAQLARREDVKEAAAWGLTPCVACSTSGAPGGPLWGAWWQRGSPRAAGAFERLDAVLETYTDVTRFPR